MFASSTNDRSEDKAPRGTRVEPTEFPECELGPLPAALYSVLFYPYPEVYHKEGNLSKPFLKPKRRPAGRIEPEPCGQHPGIGLSRTGGIARKSSASGRKS